MSFLSIYGQPLSCRNYKKIVQLISRYCIEAQSERWKRRQTFRETYRQLTKEQFQKTGDTSKYFEHQIIQQNFQKIWQVGQLGYTIQLFFDPKLEQNSSIAHKTYIFDYSISDFSYLWYLIIMEKIPKKTMISRSLTEHLTSLE